MPEIKIKKRLPNLTPEEERIFTDAIAEAYQRGRADAKPKWIPVAERLPERKGSYLVCSAKGSVCTAHWYASRWSHEHLKVTHWMEMPMPPKVDSVQWAKYRDVMYCPKCLCGISESATIFEDVTRDMSCIIAEDAELKYCPVCGTRLDGGYDG